MTASAGSAPAAPDYQQASQEDTDANRINTSSPYGSTTYSVDPNDPYSWTQTTSLSPGQQQELDYSTNAGDIQAATEQNVAGLVANNADNLTSQEAALGPAPTYNPTTAFNNAYNSIVQRNQPQQQEQQEQLESQLANEGVAQGTNAWNTSMMGFNDQVNDFNLGAQSQAEGQATQDFSNQETAYQNQLASMLQEYQLPISELQALQSGSQITMPQGISPGSSSYLTATDQAGQYMTDAYDQQAANANATNAGEWELASALASSAGKAASS